jgi:hypothetical protein
MPVQRKRLNRARAASAVLDTPSCNIMNYGLRLPARRGFPKKHNVSHASGSNAAASPAYGSGRPWWWDAGNEDLPKEFSSRVGLGRYLLRLFEFPITYFVAWITITETSKNALAIRSVPSVFLSACLAFALSLCLVPLAKKSPKPPAER